MLGLVFHARHLDFRIHVFMTRSFWAVVSCVFFYSLSVVWIPRFFACFLPSSWVSFLSFSRSFFFLLFYVSVVLLPFWFTYKKRRGEEEGGVENRTVLTLYIDYNVFLPRLCLPLTVLCTLQCICEKSEHEIEEKRSKEREQELFSVRDSTRVPSTLEEDKRWRWRPCLGEFLSKERTSREAGRTELRLSNFDRIGRSLFFTRCYTSSAWCRFCVWQKEMKTRRHNKLVLKCTLVSPK